MHIYIHTYIHTYIMHICIDTYIYNKDNPDKKSRLVPEPPDLKLECDAFVRVALHLLPSHVGPQQPEGPNLGFGV